MKFLAKRTIAQTFRRGARWDWVLSDYFCNTIETGRGCKTRAEARVKLRAARSAYQARLAKIITARKHGTLTELPYAGVPGNLWCNRTKSKPKETP